LGNKPIEKALDVISNRFLLTTVVARRWENIVAGAPPLIATKSGESKLAVVLEEVIDGCVTVDAGRPTACGPPDSGSSRRPPAATA